MKTIPIALQAHYDSGGTTVAHALRITRTDGQVFGFTGHDVSQQIDGVLYDASQGLDVSSIATSAGLAVDNLELTTLDDGSLFTRAEIFARVWQNAAFLIFRYNWASPADGVEYMMAGTIGEVRLMRGTITCELRGLQQYLQQPVGNVTSKTCRARFADAPEPAGNNRCRLDAAAWTDGLHVTAVTSRRTFTVAAASGSLRAADWYAEGMITWSDGANVGLQAKVKAFSGAGVMELSTSQPYDIQVGDHLLALAGCRKRLQEDCRDRFDNVLNFQGEPHLPGVDALTSPPETSA